jgi:hypothetical protein
VTPTFRFAEIAPIIRFTRPQAATIPGLTRESITWNCSKRRARKS